MTDLGLAPGALTKEKSLWQIYLQARKIPTNRFNAVSTSVVFSASVIMCWLTPMTLSQEISFVRHAAEIGFASTLSLLGFLVAGFTIFATVSNPAMLVRMSETSHPESGLSYLKHSFFVLIRVFLYYLAYAFICFVVMYLGGPKGLISILVSLSPQPDNAAYSLSKIAVIVLTTGQFFLLVQLKSFIFNIHHTVMAAVRWRAEGHD